jgi:hypothetical protein
MPKLDLLKELQARAGDMLDVTIKPSKFGPPIAFWRGKKEFAHVDKRGALDIRLTKPLIRKLKPDYRLEIEKTRDWVHAHFETLEDLDFVMKLLEMAWKQHKN